MKIGMVSFCNDGYPREVLNQQLEECRLCIPQEFQLENAGLVWDAASGYEKQCLLDDTQMLVVPCLAACGSVYAVDFLRRHFDKPILLWHIEGKKEKSGRLVTGASGAGFTSLRFTLEKLGAKHLHMYCEREYNQENFEAYFRAVDVYCKMREAKIGMAGYADLGFYTATFDHVSMKRTFGVEVEHISLLEIAEDTKNANDEEISMFMDSVNGWNNPQHIDNAEILKIAKLYAALLKQVRKRGLDALSLKCFEGITAAMGFTPCIPLSMLGSEISVGCKCDMHAMISMLILQYLAGVPAAFLELYDKTNGRILFANCGMTLEHHIDGVRSLGCFGWDGIGGVIDTSRRKEGEVTLLRIDKDNENHYIAHAITAHAKKACAWKELGWDDPVSEFPSLEIETDSEQFLRKAPGQHYALVYGDYLQEIKLLSELLNINLI